MERVKIASVVGLTAQPRLAQSDHHRARGQGSTQMSEKATPSYTCSRYQLGKRDTHSLTDLFDLVEASRNGMIFVMTPLRPSTVGRLFINV
jgi:hypothetical protein